MVGGGGVVINSKTRVFKAKWLSFKVVNDWDDIWIFLEKIKSISGTEWISWNGIEYAAYERQD